MPKSNGKSWLVSGLLLGCSVAHAHARAPLDAVSPAGAMSEGEARARANRLLAKMTLKEKAGQISQRFDIASLFPAGAAPIPGMPKMVPLDDVVKTGENTGNKRGQSSAGSTGIKRGQSC